MAAIKKAFLNICAPLSRNQSADFHFWTGMQPVQYLFRSCHRVFPHAMNSFGVEMCVYIWSVCVCFLPSSSSNTHKSTHRCGVMAFYSSSALANCCVWLAFQSSSRQVAGYVLFFCKSKQAKVLETGTFPKPSSPQKASEPRKLYCLLEEMEEGVWW